MTPGQLLMFARDDVPMRGPEGLLAALVQRGLDPGAVEIAAALCLELDRQARERNEREAAA